MAFCPHCGKSVTEQAAKCAACNGELEPRGKAVRFKGTMMMSPGTAPLIQPPNAGQPRNTAPAAQPAAPAHAASVPSGTAATMPMPAAGPIAEAAAAAAGKKPSALKATMMGTGDAGLADILKKVQQAPAPTAAAAAAAPTPLPTPMPPEPEAAAHVAPVREPAATTRREVQADEDSKRFLVGDPMAPKGSEVPSVAPKAQRHVPRISEEISTELPKDRSATIIVVGIIGVCVIAAIGYVAAKLMGLTD
jgi:pyruvate/2-oxoglutarate dehydrogenase complex dihydrolipoamide acyltransferase (E2) component